MIIPHDDRDIMSIKPSNIGGAPDKGNMLFVKFGNYRQFLMNFNKSLL